MKFTAREGQGEAVAQALLVVARSLTGTPGCELYVISRSASEPDVVWVNELWLSQDALDASLEKLQTDEGRARLAAVTGLLAAAPEWLEVEPLGGVGLDAGDRGATIVNLDQVEDQAPKFGYEQMGEARFATGAHDAIQTGVSLQRLRPGARQAFGHRHQHAEEVYIVLAGSGRVKIDDHVHELRTLDAVRVAPGSARAFEAGDDGLELLAVGPRRAGDAQVEPGFWPA